MIRPITCVCFLLACGSGLYLYQTKHRVQLLDRQIEKTVKATDVLREQTRVLHAEWTLLNDPQRLQALAEQFLSLKNVTPGQFTSLAELDNRLPKVRPAEPPAPEAPPDVPVAEAAPAQPEELPEPPLAVPAQAAAPAKPVSVAVAAPTRPVERKPAPPRPVIAQVAAPRYEPRPAPEPRAMAETPRPAAIQASSPVGSALGMAHSTFVPPPRPTPVSASQWVAPGGGG